MMAGQGSDYVPSIGTVSPAQIDKAINEFERQVEVKEDVRVLIASGVNLKMWLATTGSRMCSLRPCSIWTVISAATHELICS
jgi:hypothetical protein